MVVFKIPKTRHFESHPFWYPPLGAAPKRVPKQTGTKGLVCKIVKQAKYGFGEYGFKHRAQWVFRGSLSSGERTQWVPFSPLFVGQKRTHRVFCRTHRVCPKTQWGWVSSLLRNSPLETVFRPFPKNPQKTRHFENHPFWYPPVGFAEFTGFCWAVFCDNLCFRNAVTPTKKRKSANNSENLRKKKTANLAPFVPFSL